MTTSGEQFPYFAHALSGRQDITDFYEVLGDLPARVGVSTQNEDLFIANIRSIIDNDAGGTSDIATIAATSTKQAENLYHSNLIAAVDGTDAIATMQFVTDTIYAVGVVLVTPQTHMNPRAHVTRTQANHVTPTTQPPAGGWEEAVAQWAEYLRGAREQEHSWINTFREYHERELALEWLVEAEDHIVLIDGPIATQNMLTQDSARDLLQQILNTTRAIGFIKDLSANPLLSAIGYALEPGEAFVLASWSNILSDRFRARQGHISGWVENYANQLVRVIYRVGQRAFGMETTAANIPLGLAILQHDNQGPRDHDIPMLLQIADQAARTRFRGARARDEVIARYSRHNPSRLLSLTNERSLR